MIRLGLALHPNPNPNPNPNQVSLITASAAPGSSQCPDYAHATKAPGSRVVLSTVDTLWHAQASLHLPFPHLINYA